jgi:hypothetical protein
MMSVQYLPADVGNDFLFVPIKTGRLMPGTPCSFEGRSQVLIISDHTPTSRCNKMGLPSNVNHRG